MPTFRSAHRGEPGDVPRASLGQLAHLALRRRLPESRTAGTRWEASANVGWVRWPTEDGRFVYCAIRRRSHLITAELGVATMDVSIDELPRVTAIADARSDGWLIALGHLLHGHEKWWSSGGNEKAFLERLDWLALQLQLRLHSALAVGQVPTE